MSWGGLYPPGHFFGSQDVDGRAFGDDSLREITS